MQKHTDQTETDKTTAVSNHIAQKAAGNSASHFQDNRPQAMVQRKLVNAISGMQTAQILSQQPTDGMQTVEITVQRKANHTGLPDQLKTGIENLSGHSLDDVKVHYNSAKPAQLNALAYAQGTDIHLGSGQEKHLPHEAWHVIQQKQGRVKPTLQMKENVQINDDTSLEREADQMGAMAGKAIQRKYNQPVTARSLMGVIQRIGDKMALEPRDVSRRHKNVQEISAEIGIIYQKHKTAKKEKRNNLDTTFTQQTNHIENRQKYLIKAIEYSFYKYHRMHFEHNFPGKIDTEINKRHNALAAIEVDDREKMRLLIKAKEIADTVSPLIQEGMQERAESGGKTDIAALNTQIYTFSSSYGRHAIADPIVQHYEKGYKSSAMNLKLLTDEWGKFAKTKDYTVDTVETGKDIILVRIRKAFTNKKIPVATIYLNDQRFVPDPIQETTLASGEKRQVFRHRESKKQYVQDARNVFVKRYVNRALNKFDNKPDDRARGVQIDADPRLKKDSADTWAHIATQIPARPARETDKEIQNHQRAKEAQGGSPFVSFTTTDRPIFGSSAKLFESEEGVARVDLAKISKSRIFDTHTSAAMNRIHNIQDPDPEMAYKDGDDHYERNSAARDAMRTRELVVAGGIPPEAIESVKDKKGPFAKNAANKFQALPH